MKYLATLPLLVVCALATQDSPTGYDDTPQLPGQEWRVHDIDRPRPTVVTPGDAGAPPSDAIVLFDGTDMSAWRQGEEVSKWTVENGYMEVNGSGSMKTAESFGDVQLHVEWASPVEVVGNSQGRGNSGVFLMDKYEVQILDSYDNVSYADGQAAAMYGQYPPLVNACRGPGEWQSYDIFFTAPRFEGGELASPARVTVVHNGVLVHNAREFLGGTSHRSVASYGEHAAEGPIAIQDHGNPVRFRNVWVREL
jgi:hypothetical protein